MYARCSMVLAALVCAGCMSDPTISPRAGTPSYSPAGAMPPTLSSAANDLGIPTWQWQRAKLAEGREVAVSAPDRYTLRFEGGGRVLLRADCNRGSGGYEVNGSAMKVTPAAITRIACPSGSQDAEFLQGLSRVTGYAINDRDLVLTLSNGGTMSFRGVP
jgi:heat shock protein HslJ